ncbi:MAG: hypothetical protein WCO57_17005 [Verrucomicrobiota bacterium]
MPSVTTLIARRARLVEQVHDHLDFLVGSVSTKGFAFPAFNLTTKVEGKTRSRHIPKDLVPLVRRLTTRHRKLKLLLLELADVNWQLISDGVDLR